MKRLLIVNSLPPDAKFGGAEHSTGLLASALARSGCHVTLVVLGRYRFKPSVRGWNGVTVIELPHLTLFWPFDRRRRAYILRVAWHALERINLARLVQLSRLIWRVRPELVVTNNLIGFGSFAWIAAAAARIPAVHIARDYSLLCASGKMLRSGRRCHVRCSKCQILTFDRFIMSKTVRSFVAISEWVRAKHLESFYFGDSKACVIYNHLGAIPTKMVRASGDRFVWGFIGRLDPEKGVDTLIELFRNDLPEEKLLVAGAGSADYCDKLRMRTSGTNICLLGSINKWDFFGRVDALVVPSTWHEPFGRVVIEAAAAGILVAAQHAGGLCEAVRLARCGTTVDFSSRTAAAELLKLKSRRVARSCDSIDATGQYWIAHDSDVTKAYCDVLERVSSDDHCHCVY